MLEDTTDFQDLRISLTKDGMDIDDIITDSSSESSFTFSRSSLSHAVFDAFADDAASDAEEDAKEDNAGQEIAEERLPQLHLFHLQ